MQIAFEDHEIPICVFVPTPCRSGYFEIPPGCRGLPKFTSYGKTPLAMAVQEVAAVPGKFVISGKAHMCFRYNHFWGETTKSSQGREACKILGNYLNICRRHLKFCEISDIVEELSASAPFREIPEGRLRQAGGMRKPSENSCG